MDLFKKNNIDISTKYDLFDRNVKYSAKVKHKDKKMINKIARSRIKKETAKEYKGED